MKCKNLLWAGWCLPCGYSTAWASLHLAVHWSLPHHPPCKERLGVVGAGWACTGCMGCQFRAFGAGVILENEFKQLVLQYIALAYTYYYYVGERQNASGRPQPYL